MRILVVNPNSSDGMTRKMVESAAALVGPEVELIGRPKPAQLVVPRAALHPGTNGEVSLYIAGPEDRLIKSGDRFYDRRGKRQWCVKAIEAYEKALALNPDSVPASWKLSRCMT